MTFAERVLYKIASKGIAKVRKEDKLNLFINKVREEEKDGMSIDWLIKVGLLTDEEVTNATK